MSHLDQLCHTLNLVFNLVSGHFEEATLLERQALCLPNGHIERICYAVKRSNLCR